PPAARVCGTRSSSTPTAIDAPAGRSIAPATCESESVPHRRISRPSGRLPIAVQTLRTAEGTAGGAMDRSPRTPVGALALALALIGLCACAPEATIADGQPPATAQDGGGTVITDGPVARAADPRRSGPAVDFGGPPFGEQGDPEFESEGVWCVTVGFFWGGEAPPENVTFTVTDIISDPDGALTAEPAVCGDAGAE